MGGKVALITAASAARRTMAIALGEAGADLAIAGRSRETGEMAAREIADATGRKVRAFQADVTSGADVTRLAADVGAVDILVNNAGTNIRGTIDKLSEDDWDSVIDTNLKGPFLCSRAIGPQMVARGWGRVINLDRHVGRRCGPRALRLVEGGVLGLTRVLREGPAPA